jgi:hypothetical protein
LVFPTPIRLPLWPPWLTATTAAGDITYVDADGFTVAAPGVTAGTSVTGDGSVSLTAANTAVGAAGALVSMVIGSCVGALVLPAGSVAVTLTLLTPSIKAVVGVTIQLPSAATTAVLTSPPGKETLMVSPGVPVPLMVGVLSAVMLSPTVPVSLAKASAAAGAAGGVVSSTKLPVRGALALPAMSVTVVLVAQELDRPLAQWAAAAQFVLSGALDIHIHLMRYK